MYKKCCQQCWSYSPFTVLISNNITYQNWEWYSPESESESKLTSTRSTFTPQGSVASSSADWNNDQYWILYIINIYIISYMYVIFPFHKYWFEKYLYRVFLAPLGALIGLNFWVREVFKKLRRENLRPKNATPSDPPHPPPLRPFLPHQKLPPFFLLGNASIMGKTNFTLGPT